MNSNSLMLLVMTCSALVSGDHYDVRCKCVCPNPGVINASSPHLERKLYIKNVPPSHCDCLNVVIPSLYVEEAHVEKLPEAFCPRCVCRYEQRNTTVIKVVVVMIICVISLLVLYMGYLLLIDPILQKWKQTAYRQHKEEEDKDDIIPENDNISTVSSREDDISVMTSRGRLGRSAVLQRVGNQQDRWKRQAR